MQTITDTNCCKFITIDEFNSSPQAVMLSQHLGRGDFTRWNVLRACLLVGMFSGFCLGEIFQEGVMLHRGMSEEGRGCLRCMSGSPCRLTSALHVTVMICTTLVNTQTDGFRLVTYYSSGELKILSDSIMWRKTCKNAHFNDINLLAIWAGSSMGGPKIKSHHEHLHFYQYRKWTVTHSCAPLLQLLGWHRLIPSTGW